MALWTNNAVRTSISAWLTVRKLSADLMNWRGFVRARSRIWSRLFKRTSKILMSSTWLSKNSSNLWVQICFLKWCKWRYSTRLSTKQSRFRMRVWGRLSRLQRQPTSAWAIYQPSQQTYRQQRWTLSCLSSVTSSLQSSWKPSVLQSTITLGLRWPPITTLRSICRSPCKT